MGDLPRFSLKAPKKFQNDKTKEGWKLIQEGSPVEGESDLEFLGFLREGEAYVNGGTVLVRAKEMPGSGASQHHAERMLQNQADIPEELRPYWLVFTDTIWQRPDGYRFVPYLRWGGVGWVLSFYCVESDRWHVHDRVVRVCK